MIIIEIPHRSLASVEKWEEDAILKYCEHLIARTDEPFEINTDQDALKFGWELWTRDLYGAHSFNTAKEAKEWAVQYKGHQSIRIRTLAENLED